MLIKVTQHQKKKSKEKQMETYVFQAGLELVCLRMILPPMPRCWVCCVYMVLGLNILHVRHSTNWATSPISALLLLLCFFKEYNKTDLGMMLEEVSVKLKDWALKVACVWVLVLSVNGGIWALNLGDRAWAPALTVWIISPAQSVDFFTEENWA